MMPRFSRYGIYFCCGALGAIALAASAGRAQAQVGTSELISDTMARRHGLTRAWAARVEVDPGRGRVTEITLHGDALIAVTNAAIIHSFDAETGRTRWITKVGRAGNPITPVGAGDKYVAVCNGTTLYVLDRNTGKELFTRPVEGAPSAAPAVSPDHVYVPTLAGAIEMFKFGPKFPTHFPRAYRGNGTIEEAPVLAGDRLIWATHSGAVYSVLNDDLTARFRFMTRGEITAGLGYWPPFIFAASADGFIYAINEKTGSRGWQFSTGYPAREPPVPLDGSLYAISELSGMYCLSADKGLLKWFTKNVHQFISASATRLYTVDVIGRLKVLDRASGAPLDVLPTERLAIKVHNIQTDRVYLGSDTGLIQCLHEIELTKPYVHANPAEVQPAPPVGTAPAADKKERPAAAAAPEEPAAADDPFGNAGAP